MQVIDSNTNTSNSTSSSKLSVSDLLGEVAEHSVALAKSELQLVTLQIFEKVKGYRSGTIKLASGVMLLFLSLIVLSAGLVNYLSHYLGLTTSALIYGAVVLVAGCLFIWVGLKEFNPADTE